MEEVELALRNVLSKHRGSVAVVRLRELAGPLRLAGAPVDFVWLSETIEMLGARGVQAGGATWILERVEWRKKMKRFVFVRANNQLPYRESCGRGGAGEARNTLSL
ncbi:MAG: hypothetical protein QXF05_04605 [Thermofilaceae archaeon]